MGYGRVEIKSLLEQRKKAFEDGKALLEANPSGLNSEQRAQYDTISAEIDRLNGEIEIRERHNGVGDALEASLGRVVDTTKAQPGESRAEAAVRAFRSFVFDKGTRSEFDSKELDPYFEEKRSLTVGTNSAGGYGVQNERMGNLVEVMKWFSNVRQYADVIQTATGATFPVPVVTDTANSASTTSEEGAVATNVDPTFSQITLSSYKYISPTVLVSIELERDSSFDIVSWLTRALGMRLARKLNSAYTVGTGSSQPQGFVTGAGTGKTAAATNAVTFDEVIDLMHSLDIAYRPGAIFQAHDNIIAAIRKLKDSQNRYLWEPSLQVGVPDRLLGYSCIANNDMASSLATGNKVLNFGNLREGFIVRDIGSPGFVRLGELYAATLQTGFLAYQFSDSKVKDATALKNLVLA